MKERVLSIPEFRISLDTIHGASEHLKPVYAIAELFLADMTNLIKSVKMKLCSF
jgi:hypothetical protein